MINKLKSNKLGALTGNKVTPEKVNEIIDNMSFNQRVELSSSQIKTGSSVPITVIEAPGIGKAIELVSGSVRYIAGSAAFSGTSDTIQLKTSGAAQVQAYSNFTIDGTTSTFDRFLINNGGNSNYTLVENKPLLALTGGDSAVGNGRIILYLYYRIITL